MNIYGGEDVLVGKGQVDLSPAQAGLFGDINDDGSVNNKDVVKLFRYILSNATDGDLSVYDINKDGKINTKDVIALFRVILG